MKSIKFLLLIFVATFFYKNAKSQIYTMGDITAIANITAFHDSNNCASMAFEQYSFTVQNSFLGDSLLIKDQNNGTIMASAYNTTGQNPWVFSLNPNSMMPFLPDNMLAGGVAYFGGTPIKFISGSDTIFNVTSFFALPVANPCVYGNVSGQVYIDNNNDCAFNSGDINLQNIFVTATDTLSNSSYSSQSAYTNSNGNYNFQLQQSWMTGYSIGIPAIYQFIYPASSCNPVLISSSTLPQTNVNFALQCSSAIDVQAGSMHPINARVGLPFIINPFVSNTGCDSAFGTLTLVKDAHTIYNALLSSNPATYVNGDTLKWNYVNLTNLSTNGYWNSFMAGVYLTPNSTVAIGDTLCFSIASTIMNNDINSSNNQSSFCIPVINSYDPNVKEVSPKGYDSDGKIPASTPQLNYTIHFQNTGNAPAINISVLDTLDSHLDLSSLRIVSSSHSMTPEWVSNNVIKFNFNNIWLADSASNEPASHGTVQYSIKLKTNLALGTTIKNTANIYFDTNPAIVTNTTLNTIAIPLATSNVELSTNKLTVFPNPCNDKINLSLPSNVALQKNATVVIYSLNNEKIATQTVSNTNSTIDVKQLPPGFYFMQLINDTQTYQAKFYKNE